MHYETINVTFDSGIDIVQLHRPDSMNAMTTQMRAEITHAFNAAPGRGVGVVVLTGAGRAFCSGQDLGDARSAASIDLERVLRDEYAPMLRAVRDCPVPTIAAVNGAAAGAGANLALACDVVIAAESAYFLQAFARIGLMPDAGGTWTMPRRMGLAKSLGASLFAEKITARQADDWGLIWEAVPDALFETRWRARAEYLANGPALAFRAIKDTFRDSLENDFETQIALEAHRQGELGNSRDFKEGILAFLEKRPAKFEGR